MNPDFLVVGAGVAGLRAAIELAEAGEVLVIAKDQLHESSSEYAQGGIAAALSDDDEVALHEQDTLAAGAGLCDPAAVRTLVEEGPAAIEQLIAWGAAFDREGGRLAFAREGAHSRNRVLHAHGDSTGHEIARALYERASSLPNVNFQSCAAVTDLLLDGKTVTGAVLFDGRTNQLAHVYARGVLLATGGLGRVFRETTNPAVASGDGVAVAWRAGATIGDIEFVQFHPTALHLPGVPRFLLSEALRGEGAYLRNARGERFMIGRHPMAELAPRDVVARSIVAEGPPVYLDLTHLDPAHVRERFPRIHETCLRHGVDIALQPAPVFPAAHYAMGGVKTDLDGRTNVAGLFAAGEAACTGVHGANRLASNSLLEGVVFGARAGRAMRRFTIERPQAGDPPEPMLFPQIAEADVRDLSWEKCGIVRDGPGLAYASTRLAEVPLMHAEPTREHFELRNIFTVALLIAECALAREESRGAHYRTDFPQPKQEFERHSAVTLDRRSVRA